MTHSTKPAPRRSAISLAPAMTALLLAGCSTGHIGESWQCPLAEGGSCDSVAAADPAVPEAGASGSTVLAGPLWRVRGEGRPELPAAPSCAAECDGGFDPFAWLARLFADTGADTGADGRGAAAGAPARAAQDPAAEGAPASDGAVPAAGIAASPVAAGGSEPPPDGPVPLPADAGPSAEPGPVQDDPAGDDADDDPPGADLRTGEVVARIWIAPFVDADGVYREASHVRVVLAPAGWRLK